MSSRKAVFHAGEIDVQRRAGVSSQAEQVGRIIAGRIPDDLGEILAEFRVAVAASIDARGRLWASLLTGPPGFLDVVNATRLHLDARAPAGDPLEANLAGRPEMGLLVIDPATRRRLRFNGHGRVDRDGGIALDVEQVYGNCRKYIQLRRLVESDLPAMPRAAAHSQTLSAAQRDRIAVADTFFIASAHPEGGADASHRGGRPGFVRVHGDRSLSFPDYPGNNMFNTLGNLAVDPRAGLLFVDFDRGDVLQVTGRARLVWEHDAAPRHPLVEYDIDEVIDLPAGSPLRWKLLEPSPFNP